MAKPNTKRAVLPGTATAPAIQFRTIATPDGEVLREPLVQNAEWKDPDDDGAYARRQGARVIHGQRAVWQVARLHGTSPNEITAAHLKAAERYLNDWNVRNGPLRSQLGQGAGGGDTPIVNAAVRAGAAMDAVAAALGPSALRILNIVVINNRPVSVLAGALGIAHARAFGRFVAAIERLREHYQPPAKPRAHVEPPPPDVDDVPAERLGRWKRPAIGAPA
jgi:hypothetical protein